MSTSELYQVLLVEDDRLIAKSLKMSLPYHGFEVTACALVREALETFGSKRFDLLLLDVNLPDGSGIDLCRQIRASDENVPILMVTAQVDEESAVRGLGEGADDYIRKPYGVQELAARMKRLLGPRKKMAAPLRFASLRLDTGKRQAWAGEHELNLGRREFEILILLVRKAGDVVTRDEILNTLGEQAEIYDRTIDSHLSHIRRKLKSCGTSGVQIAPVYGVGYRLMAEEPGDTAGA